MTDKPTRSTKPANNDVIIWEHTDTGGYLVTRWTIFFGRLAAKHYDTKKKAVQAVQEVVADSQVSQVDVWIRRDDKPAYRWRQFRPHQ